MREDVRRARRRAGFTQQDVADEITAWQRPISVRSLAGFEIGDRALPHDLTPMDIFDAIERLRARRRPGGQG